MLFGDVARPELVERLKLGHAARAGPDDGRSGAGGAAGAAGARGCVPNLPIVARARDTAHAAELYKAGVTDAVPETLEASLQLSEAVLVDLGVAMGPVIASIHEKRDRAASRDQGGGRAGGSADDWGAAKAARTRLGRDLLQRVADRRERLLGLGAVGSAALGHVGTAAAALPAERRDRRLDEVDRADLAGKIVGDADRDAGAALIDRDQAPQCPSRRAASSCRRSTQVLGIEAFDHLAEELVAADMLRAPAAVGFGRAAAHRQRLLRLGQLALEPRRSSTSAATRAGTSSGEALSVAAASRSLSSRSPSHWRAASPVSASMRRTPEETALSEMILSSWISPSARTWVPPHSSTE